MFVCVDLSSVILLHVRNAWGQTVRTRTSTGTRSRSYHYAVSVVTRLCNNLWFIANCLTEFCSKCIITHVIVSFNMHKPSPISLKHSSPANQFNWRQILLNNESSLGLASWASFCRLNITLQFQIWAHWIKH